MAYDSEDKWSVPARLAYPKRHQITKGRRAGGRFEGLSAVYLGGQLVAQATTVADTRADAVRGAARLARGLADAG